MVDRLLFPYPPFHTLWECNRQVHGGDLVEYFIDSWAIAFRILLTRWIWTKQHPNPKTSIPRKKTPNPTPTNTGNPNFLEVTAVIPPAMNSAIPPSRHRVAVRPQIITSIRDDVALFIFPIDSWNSSCPIMPLRRAG